MFSSEFSEFLTQLCSLSPSILLLGDFNIHVDSLETKATTDLFDILNDFNITQHVVFHTHRKGHILDPVRISGIAIDNLTDLAISDHLAIICDVDMPVPSAKQKRTMTFQKLSSINLSSLPSTITATIAQSLDATTTLVSTYNNILSSCFNTIASLKTKTVSFTRSAPWYTNEL